MIDNPYSLEQKYLQEVYRCETIKAINRRVVNLDDYDNHFIQDYYLAFNVIMCKFNVNYLKSGDLSHIAGESEYLLPLLRERTRRIRARTTPLPNRINKIAEIKSVQLLAKLTKIDETNRTKEYVKRLMNELHAHSLVLWYDERDVAMYRFPDMTHIKLSIKLLTIKLNKIIAFNQITKKI